MTVKWEEPPPARSGRKSTLWRNILAELDARPGEWAVVSESIQVSQVSGMRVRYPDYEFTGRGEGLPPNRVKLYARRKVA